MEELISNKIYYKIFDKTDQMLTHRYINRNYDDSTAENQVNKNIDIILNYFNAEKLLLLNQVHGCEVFFAKTMPEEKYPQADASVTMVKNLVLGIMTADCVPVLMTNQKGTIIGAAHCGWRSAKLDIIENLANLIKKNVDDKIYAIIGPSIAQISYEVSSEFYSSFVNDSKIYKKFFTQAPQKDHYMFDLPSFVKYKIEKSNIQIIKHIQEDTYNMKNKYPSYRRSCHTQEVYNQNILSAIVIK